MKPRLQQIRYGILLSCIKVRNRKSTAYELQSGQIKTTSIVSLLKDENGRTITREVKYSQRYETFCEVRGIPLWLALYSSRPESVLLFLFYIF